MENTIFFYSGTGNSLWTARKLAQKLENTELVPMTLTGNGKIHSESQRVGIIFPVHIWGLPQPVIDFVNRLEVDPAKYYFALGVNAGQVAATLLQLKNIMKQRGLNLSSGFSICLPSNYIPWGSAISEKKQQELFQKTEAKIDSITPTILAKEEKAPEHSPHWQNIFLSALYHLTFSMVPKMDKSFSSDEKCTGCRICEKICPANNIVITDKKPVWQHRCEQCFACLQWCPEEAIQYGKNTATKKRYHHPDIKLHDMLACIPPKNR
jgi:ferredoxin